MLLALALGTTSASGPAQAESALLDWVVQAISVDEDGGVIPASTGQEPASGSRVAPDQRISSGAQARIVLVNGRDLVAMQPDTTIEIGDQDSATSRANIELVTGTIHVEVGKRAPGQTFSVETRYLVATVKGTKFDVAATDEGATVSVTEGLVGVRANRSGDGVDVPPGMSAVVSRDEMAAPTLTDTPEGGAAALLEQATPDGIGSQDGGNQDGTDSADAASDAGGSNTGGGDTSGEGSGGGEPTGEGSSDDGSDESADAGAAASLGDTVSDTAGAVGDTVSDVTGAVGGALGGPVGGAVGGLGGALGGAVGGLGGALGGALGGK